MKVSFPANNLLQGRCFESRFMSEAKLQGFYARKNELRAKFGWKGRLIRLPGDLDFMLVNKRTGRIGFFDCKAFSGKHFTYSDLTSHQIDQAALLNEMHVPAGFVVLFGDGSVVLFTGHQVMQAGPGKRFTPSQGLRLGTVFEFNLGPLMRKRGGSKTRKYRHDRCGAIDKHDIELGRHFTV